MGDNNLGAIFHTLAEQSHIASENVGGWEFLIATAGHMQYAYSDGRECIQYGILYAYRGVSRAWHCTEVCSLTQASLKTICLGYEILQ